ncbi:Ff.00g114600.m01.CDS01 [Fusarium sp. VM40]|nr:Ff.00g114600.m01.CDS01 [Fusarium sp. VM40]
MAENKPRSPAHYAILIGINAYQDQPLKGCVHDVQCIKTLLEQQPFPVDIRTFTATSNSQSDKSSPVEDRSYWPTYWNVTEALRLLTAQAQPGDYVYIHYSGHGTYMDIVSKFTNHHTGDLALALLNGENGDSIRPFGGHRMAMALNAMVIKRLVVTLVLDCCFSASVYRGDQPDIRFIPVSREVASAYFIDNELASQDEGASDSGRRDVSMRPSWMMDPKGYAVLVASGPQEMSTEVIQNGIHYGALSRFLYLGLRDGGLMRRQKDIFYRLFSKFRGVAIKQTPALYGNKDQVFFGQSTLPSNRPVIPVERSGEKPILQAGQAHGVSEGDSFILYPTSVFEKDEPLHSNIISAIVEKVYPLTSLLRLEDTSNSVAKIDWVAETQTKQAIHKFPVLLAENLLPRDEWLKEFDKHSISIHSANDSCPPFFLVALVDNEYKIRDKNDQDIMNLPNLQQDHTSPEDIAAILNHLAAYRLVKELINHSVADDFRASFDISVITQAKEHLGPDRTIDVSQGNSNEYMFELCLQNKGNKYLYLYIFDLGPLWQVEGIYHGTYAVVPPKSLKPRRPGRFSKKLGTSVPKELRERGIQQCDDTLKVLVTSHPTSFDLLELPEMGGLPREQASGRRQGSGDNSPEQWAAFNFLVKTTLAAG